MAPAPLTFVELGAWAQRTGLEATLAPWEYLGLRSLSTAWCVQRDKAAEPDCPPPYSDSDDAEYLRATSMSLRDSIRRMAS